MVEQIPSIDEIGALAIEAGKILLSRFGKSHHVKYKSLIDPVTEADKLSEAFLLENIYQKYPDHQIIAEESGNNHQTSRYCWFIDPLDGTVNFAHGIPIFCVSIGFAIDEQIFAGAVYDPTRKELFTAQRGQGAFLNRKRISCSESTSLISSLLVTGFPYDIATTAQNNLHNYSSLAKNSQGVRRLGSAALDCCYVADGRFDGYWELAVQPWDVAAGILIAEEAGAQVTTVEGTPVSLKNTPSILCAAPQIHSHLLKELN